MPDTAVAIYQALCYNGCMTIEMKWHRKEAGHYYTACDTYEVIRSVTYESDYEGNDRILNGDGFNPADVEWILVLTATEQNIDFFDTKKEAVAYAERYRPER